MFVIFTFNDFCFAMGPSDKDKQHKLKYILININILICVYEEKKHSILSTFLMI